MVPMNEEKRRLTERPDRPGRRPDAQENDNAHEVPGNTVPPAEIGGRNGPDPTRFGDWEKDGRCVDF